jgi:hypothetical protein
MREFLTPNKAELEPGEDRICRGKDCDAVLVRGLPLCRDCDCNVYGKVYDSVKKEMAKADKNLARWLEERYPKDQYIAVFDWLREVFLDKYDKLGAAEEEGDVEDVEYNYTILTQKLAQVLMEHNVGENDFLKAEKELTPKQRRRL